MTKLLSIGSLFMVFGTTACLDGAPGPLDKGGGIFRDGSVSSSWTGDAKFHDVTVAARDVDGDGTIVNSETYASFDQGFKLDLPGGHYRIDVTDANHHVIAIYKDVLVDGDITMGEPNQVVTASATP